LPFGFCIALIEVIITKIKLIIPGDAVNKAVVVLGFICLGMNASEKMENIKSNAFQRKFGTEIVEMVQNCNTVILMAGAFKSNSLNTNQKVVIVEPSSHDSKCKVSEDRIRVQSSFDELYKEHGETNYALVISLPLKISDGAWKKLHPLIEKSKVAVFAHSEGNKNAFKQFKDLKESIVSRNWQNIPQQATIFAANQLIAHYSIHVIKQENEEKK
jgi:hypothetical protein